MTLEKWMADNGYTDDTLAPKVESDRTTISKIRRGKRLPSFRLALRIYEFTGRKVKLEQLAEAAA